MNWPIGFCVTSCTATMKIGTNDNRKENIQIVHMKIGTNDNRKENIRIVHSVLLCQTFIFSIITIQIIYCTYFYFRDHHDFVVA